MQPKTNEILPKNGNYPAGLAGLGEGEVLGRTELEDGPRGHLLRRAEDEGRVPPAAAACRRPDASPAVCRSPRLFFNESIL